MHAATACDLRVPVHGVCAVSRLDKILRDVPGRSDYESRWRLSLVHPQLPSYYTAALHCTALVTEMNVTYCSYVAAVYEGLCIYDDYEMRLICNSSERSTGKERSSVLPAVV